MVYRSQNNVAVFRVTLWWAVHCSTSWDQFHSYGSHVQVAISRSILESDIRPRQAVVALRSIALLTTSTPLLLPHMYVYSSPST